LPKKSSPLPKKVIREVDFLAETQARTVHDGMKIDTDSRGRRFIGVGNIRLTYIAAADRAAGNWAGQDVIRVQAYRNAKSGPLHRGAEFPVGDPSDVLELVGAICRLYSGDSDDAE
jgi:hypothetical protein